MQHPITQINHHISCAWSKTTALYARTAAILGIGYPELMVLYALVVEGRMTQREIGENYGMQKQTVNTVIKSLHTRGYVQLTPGTIDKREKVVALTETGQPYAENLLQPLLDAEEQAYRMIGVERSQAMADTLDLYNMIMERTLDGGLHHA